MELELATITDITNELSRRGLQFVIAIERTKINDGTMELEISADASKDMHSLQMALIPFFGIVPDEAV